MRLPAHIDNHPPDSARPFEADHQFLTKMLNALEAAELQLNAVVLLEQLNQYLPNHLEAEEAPHGLFEYILQKAPHQQPEVDRLKREHPVMLELLNEARMAARTHLTLSPHGRERISHLVDVIKKHEQAEAALMQQVLNREDVGG